MLKKNSFIEGTFIATSSIIFIKLLGMLYVIPFYSIIGSQGSALYSYAYNIYMIFLSISSAGIPMAMSKLVSEYDSQELKEAKVRSFKLGVLIVSILSVICFLILIIFAELIAKLIVGNVTGGNSLSDITLVIFVASFSVLIIPILSISKGYLQGHKYIKISSMSQMIEQIVRILVILAGSFIAIKLFHSSIAVGVSIAISGAFFGGLVAIFYILRKMQKNKDILGFKKNLKKDQVSNKAILKKIIVYSMPFIIINITVNIYNTVDMSLIIRTLGKLNFNGADAEYISAVVTTWGYKLNMIVNAIATGLTVNLIPSMSENFVKKNVAGVSNILNKALQIVLFCSIPAACGLSFLAKPVWNVFYGANYYGSSVFTISILTSIFCNVYMISIQAGQSLNRYKSVYIAVISGFITNAILDVPLMRLCYSVNIPAYYGALFATICGYLIAISISLKNIKKIKGISYKSTLSVLIRVIATTLIMLLILFLLKQILPFHNGAKLLSIVDIVIYAFVGAFIYLFIMYKLKVVDNLFGKKMTRKIVQIITFNLYRKKEDENDIKKD